MGNIYRHRRHSGDTASIYSKKVLLIFIVEENERYFACPYCGETISMLLDLSVGEQNYVEDCEVCCRPIEIYFTVNENAVELWRAERTDA